MKFIKLTSDITLGISLVLFSYIYWIVYRGESDSLYSWTTEEITNITVDLFYVALVLSIVSIICRGTVIKQQEHKSKLSWTLIIVATIPLMKWLFDTFAYIGG